MSTAQQAAFMNQRSFGEPAPTVIGQAFGGGFWAGQISTTGNSVATHNLVIGPLSTAQFTGAWKTSNTNTPGTTSVINGPANTAAMIAAGASDHPCAQFCDNLVVGGFSDWYMPARNELEVCYFNLKPTTALNAVNTSGSNVNAVPARTSPYTSETPARTSAAAFQSGGTEPFVASIYWASNQVADNTGQLQNFSNGNQYYTLKYFATVRVRAVRRSPV